MDSKLQTSNSGYLNNFPLFIVSNHVVPSGSSSQRYFIFNRMNFFRALNEILLTHIILMFIFISNIF